MSQRALLTTVTALTAAIGVACGSESATGGAAGADGGATIQIFTNTLGVNVDADGYRVRVTGQGLNRTEQVGPVDDVTFSGLAEGGYTVALEAVAANCTPDPTEVSFTLTTASPRLIAFSILCS